jgi:hypothetical protein
MYKITIDPPAGGKISVNVLNGLSIEALFYVPQDKKELGVQRAERYIVGAQIPERATVTFPEVEAAKPEPVLTGDEPFAAPVEALAEEPTIDPAVESRKPPRARTKRTPGEVA